MALQENTVLRLLNSPRDKMLGNHRVETRGIGEVYRSFYYHGTEIVRVWDDTRVFWTDDTTRGSKSTTAACNKYVEVLTNEGYSQIEKGAVTNGR